MDQQRCEPPAPPRDAPAPPPRMGRFAPLWRRLAYRIFDNHYFCRRIRCNDGAFDLYVTPGSQLALLRPLGVRVDPVHARFIERWVKPDSVVWDIGANVGMFAFPAALRARHGHVYAFEADVDIASKLMLSRRRPRNRNIALSVAPVALSDREGLALFQIAAFGRAMNRLANVSPWSDGWFVAAETRFVPTKTVDTLAEILPPPTIVKIDVEGAEMLVLNGARSTIAKQRPVMLIEGPRKLAQEMGAFLHERDYIIFDGEHDRPQPIELPVWNTVAVPRDLWEAQGGERAPSDAGARSEYAP